MTRIKAATLLLADYDESGEEVLCLKVNGNDGNENVGRKNKSKIVAD